MSFSSIVGQNYAKQRVQLTLTSFSTQAYLITGASGIGKTFFAKQLAQALLCQNLTSNGACDHCPSCHYFLSSNHPDFKYIDVQPNDKNIKVQEIRNSVTSDVLLASQLGERKVYVLEADFLQEEGQNALLKTLEEPPKHAFFILTATDQQKLLPTINSRCTHISLTLNSVEEIMFILKQQLSLKEEQAVFFAKFSHGIPGQALKLSQNDWFFDLREDILQVLIKLKKQGKCFALLDGYHFFEENKDLQKEILLFMQLIFRDIACLLVKKEKQALYNSDKEQELIFLTRDPLVKVEQVKILLEVIRDAQKSLAYNCSFESTICQMLLSIQKELKNA